MSKFMEEVSALVEKYAHPDYMPTNCEYIVRQLAEPNWLDDGGTSYEATVGYRIECPYIGDDERAHCHGRPDEYITGPRGFDHCSACKMEWLEQVMDE